MIDLNRFLLKIFYFFCSSALIYLTTICPSADLTYVLDRSSIRILNIGHLLLFSTGSRSGKNQNIYSKFQIRHMQIDELQRTLSSKLKSDCHLF